MECKWRPLTRPTAPRRPSQQTSEPLCGLSQSQTTQSPATDTSPGPSGLQQSLHAVDEVFDYASFMWDSGDFWQQVSPEIGSNVGLNTHVMVGSYIP